jgi:hypothetical protein
MPSNHPHTEAQAQQEQALLELYNALMKQVEPDLLTDTIDALDFMYAGETEEERAARMDRYAKAIVLVEERMKFLMGKWEEHMGDVKKGILAKLKITSDSDDTQAISSLDTAIDIL